jgi:hypothetical protein
MTEYRPPPEIDAALRDAARATGVPVTLLTGIAWIESRFDPRAVSPRGAQGLMQLMPATQQRYGVTDPFDARQSALGAAKFVAKLLKALDWDVAAALAAYNWGPTAYAQAKTEGRAPLASVQKYVRQVLAAQHYYRSQVFGPTTTLMRALNDAIETLAAENPSNVAATQERGAWREFYAARSNDSDASAVMNPVAKAHWRAYRTIYERAAIDDQTPLPDRLEPDFWGKAVKVVDRATKAIGDAALGVGSGLFLLAVFWFAVSTKRRG